jgi:hypothetical protein
MRLRVLLNSMMLSSWYESGSPCTVMLITSLVRFTNTKPASLQP